MSQASPPLSHRSAASEILDEGTYADREMSGNLADLRFYNTWFGGTRVLISQITCLLRNVEAHGRLTILDIATGSADVPVALTRWGKRRGLQVEAFGLDSNADVLGEARLFRARERVSTGLLQADARSLPLRDSSIDIVVCSNFLHHLGDEAALTVLREMKRVARIGVVAIDLSRRRSALAMVWLLTRLTTLNRLTRHDGPLSVQRAFTREEATRIAEEAGLEGVTVRSLGPVRMALTFRVTP